MDLERHIGKEWNYRRKSRLEAGGREFSDLSSWLRYFKSPAGAQEGGGGITRWITGDELNGTDLVEAVRKMAHLFQPLMSSIRPQPGEAPLPSAEGPGIVGRSFATLFGEMLAKFEDARRQSFREVPELWALMDEIQTRLDNLGSGAKRPYIISKWSLGKGAWASIPWVALLNGEVTTSIQSGIYVVLLVSEDLSTIYATLNQGMSGLVNELGQKAAVRSLRERSEAYRAQLGGISREGVKLDSDIDLQTDSWRGKNYEVGTIAYERFDRRALPPDQRFEEVIESLLSAYDQIVEAHPEPAAQDLERFSVRRNRRIPKSV